MTATPMIPVSWGELLDKITILEIKQARLEDAAQRANVAAELTALAAVAGAALTDAAVAATLADLKAVNEKLWMIEDALRDKEATGTFDTVFVELARAVYFTNDRRAALKREINRLLNSVLVEEKSYRPYARPAAS
jgi:hypothetical protein